jgi:hypothetical protein
MNGQIADLDAKTEWGGVKAAQFDAASGDAFDLVDDAASNPGLKSVGSRIPGEACGREHGNAEKHKEVTPELARRQVFGFCGH